MKRRTFVKTLPGAAVLAGTVSGNPVNQNEFMTQQPLILPKPDKEGGLSVLAAFRERRTNRKISSKVLPLQVLSNLLWSAFGVNREILIMGKPGRTAPSASNSQEIDLYVALPEGVYLYEAVPHRLYPVVSGDFRKMAGYSRSTAAPVIIFFVVDLSRYDTGPDQPDGNIGDPEVQKSYYYTDTGFIAQNIYLFAASQGLAAWFHNCNKSATAKEFKLNPQQKVLFAQTIGFPEGR